jgi:hypothetical protein
MPNAQLAVWRNGGSSPAESLVGNLKLCTPQQVQWKPPLTPSRWVVVRQRRKRNVYVKVSKKNTTVEKSCTKRKKLYFCTLKIPKKI